MITTINNEHKKVYVPNLRFPEFEGEWEKCKLGDLCNVLMCKRILASQTNTEEGVPFYKIGTIGNAPDAYISKELFDDYKTKYNYPHKGEVMITCAGTVGKCVIYDGKDAFSEYEYSTIKELIHNKPSVIATGGGTVTYDKTVKLMRNNGLVVFVNRDVNHILDDLDLEIRPLVKESIEYIFNVYEERYPLYEEVAHIKIGNEGSITDAVQEIIEALPNTEK